MCDCQAKMHPDIRCSTEGCHCHDEDMPTPEQNAEYDVVRERMKEVDRNARAYGFEIGRGHPLVETLLELSPDNPFLQKDWKEKAGEVEPIFATDIPVMLSSTQTVIGYATGAAAGDRCVLTLSLRGDAGRDLMKVLESVLPVGLSFVMVPKDQLKAIDKSMRGKKRS